MNSTHQNVRAARVVRRLISPIESFLALETAGGIVLLISTLIAMAWANSPWHESYEHFIHLPIGLSLGHFSFVRSLHYWVNDGLMVIFFFVVGLEIKRELVLGELSSPRKAALPMFAAIGGMVAPALIYAAFNAKGTGSGGWGIPMATDIAFAVGVLTLMGNRAPFSLKVFLLALAIVDDLGAVFVIAFFYTDHVVQNALGIATAALGFVYLLRLSGIRNFIPYLILGLIVWVAILQSGVHATIAGVLLGLITPIQPFFERNQLPEKFKSLVNDLSDEFSQMDNSKGKLSEVNEHRLFDLHHYVLGAQSALDRFIHILHPWVSYFIMPLFALVNAGVRIHGVSFEAFLSHPVAIGVILGLVLGKPLGIVLFSALAVRLNIAQLPTNVSLRQLTAVGMLAGIGFTMAIFISDLALDNPELLMVAKLGVLLASVLSGIIGALILALQKNSSTS